MILPLRWAQDFANIETTPGDFADRMTMSGSKVETYDSEASHMKNVVVGRIANLTRHPDSDHLWICQVDVGGDEPVQIVTGAQNLKEGDYCPTALHGAKLPNGMEIKRGKLRGVASNGMLCSLGELGLTTHDFPNAVEDGILVLEEAAPLGQDAAVALGMDDYSFEFEITPNRPDCLSVRGLAREAAATYGVPFDDKQPKAPKGTGDVAQHLSVAVQATQTCSRYAAAMVENVRIKPSPQWLRTRLRNAGVRPINNIVDITNYVMLEYGHPMHAFDYAYVNGGKITVRMAKPGEQIMTLDGTERVLDNEMMVIADEKGPIAVAGVMGGEYSGVYETTNRVVFEAACFDGPSVRATSKRLGLRTESSSRFEKGLDPANAGPALRRALELVAELDAGDVIGGVLDDYPAPRIERVIPFRPGAINTLLGIELPEEQIAAILRPLGFELLSEAGAAKATAGQPLHPVLLRPSLVNGKLQSPLTRQEMTDLLANEGCGFAVGHPEDPMSLPLSEEDLRLLGGDIVLAMVPAARYDIQTSGDLADEIQRLAEPGSPAATQKAPKSATTPAVRVPTSRYDVARDCDLAEEVARFVGYNKIPSTGLSGSVNARISPRQAFNRKVGETLVGYGFWECETFSFYSPKGFDAIRLPQDSPLRNTVKLLHPLGEDTSIMRTTALPSMLDVVARNWAGRTETAALYEFATEYLPAEDESLLPTERQKAILAAYGDAWDYAALKGAVEGLLQTARVGRYEVVRNTENPTYHPGRCADVYLLLNAKKGEAPRGLHLATLGEVHPTVLANYGIKPRVVMADVNLDVLFAARGEVPQYRQLPRFPAITRDLALVADDAVPAADIAARIEAAAGKTLESLSLFDVYTGEKLGAGKKSLAYSLVLRGENATLTDEDADKAVARILKNLAEIGVALRA